MRFTKITIIARKAPSQTNVNDLLKWFGASLGLFNLRDKDSSCFRIFVILVNDLRSGKIGLSSDEIAYKANLSRGTVVHHLNKLIESGLVVNADNKYFLKVNSLEELVFEVEDNITNYLENLKLVGRNLDEKIGLK